MKTEELIKNDLREYLKESALSDIGKLKDDSLIFDSGILDSMGLLFLIEFLNDKYKIEVKDEELVPVNFESINNITDFVKERI